MGQSIASFFDDLEKTEEFALASAKLEFALEIVRFMEREGLSKAELAERLKVSRPMVSKLLSGDSNVTIETMVKASRSLGGKLFIKIVRDGWSARLFEIARQEMHRPTEQHRVPREPWTNDPWDFAANECASEHCANETEPLAA